MGTVQQWDFYEISKFRKKNNVEILITKHGNTFSTPF